ncbi:MAG: DUF928 domain-containing protein [Leptolyngbyaceae cyanobacterium RU_5_1]|nr:DUF928 domain-containing protein [Leptolyngbyaceae cyanobacterium RU_5_1]
MIFAAPPPPSGIGAPGRRRDGGGRPSCNQESQSVLSDSKPLTALVPTSPAGVVWGLTIADRSTFWFYSPYSSAMDGVFVLEDETKQQTEYKMTLAGAPGVIRFTLPPTAAPLAIGTPYRWYFKVYCKDDHTQPIAFVEGNLQRQSVSTTFKNQLAKASDRDRVALYAANGIWHEALEAAADLRRSNVEETSWLSLLSAIGLQDIARKPLVDCCK